VARERRDRRVEEILREARSRGVPWSRVPRRALDRLAGGSRHQGVLAELGALAYASREEALERAPRPELLLVLDGVEDPGNLGAILRSAAGTGTGAVFLPRHRAAGLSPGALRSSAGTAGRVPVVRERNLADLVGALEEREVACWALDPEGETPWDEADLTVPLALVAGGEERGLRRLVRERCRGGLRLPLAPGVESLNVSVAVGAVLFEALRQRRKGAGGRKKRT
jgi:23S rRNA (guanosine2251-2'-O)-methyltransferase